MKIVPFQRQAGFSLTELIAVIGVLAVGMGLGTMMPGMLTSTSLSASSREFADFINLCRSEAIAGHTTVRLGIAVTPFEGNPDSAGRRYSSWSWNKARKQFEQKSNWRSFPNDLILEPSYPQYLRESEYAKRDGSSIRGDFLLESQSNRFTSPGPEGEAIEVSYIEFLPSGRARIPPGSEMRNLILVLRAGRGAGKARQTSTGDSQSTTRNWVQINVDTLTGRFQIYRP